MPEEALMEFPPGLTDLSSRWTGTLWATSWEAADNPARPEPTTMTCLTADGVNADGAIVNMDTER